MTVFEKGIGRKQVGSEHSDSGLVIIVWEEMTNLEKMKIRFKKSVKSETAQKALAVLFFCLFLVGRRVVQVEC